jgi:precorrin-8X/cobalt-precorrin-8 methylmutase
LLKKDFMKNIRHPMEPGSIEKRSFEIIEAEIKGPRPFVGAEWQVVRRMIHATADFELLSLTYFHPSAIKAGIDSLLSGCKIVTDTEMARTGITSKRMEHLGCKVRCYINLPKVRETAATNHITRASAAVDYVAKRLTGSIYIVGNAPTALLRLLELAEKGQCKPALIVGMPVGFVNAAESKELLIKQDMIPFITIKGRKGGSALAASVINELAEMALEKKGCKIWLRNASDTALQQDQQRQPDPRQASSTLPQKKT